MQYFINKKEKNIHRSKNSNITRGEIVTKKKNQKQKQKGVVSINFHCSFLSFSRYFHFKSFPKSNIFLYFRGTIFSIIDYIK